MLALKRLGSERPGAATRIPGTWRNGVVMSANQIIVPQGWRYGAPILSHYQRITESEAQLLLRNGAIQQVDVIKRLWRLRLVEICDSTRVNGGRLAL